MEKQPVVIIIISRKSNQTFPKLDIVDSSSRDSIQIQSKNEVSKMHLT